ncbi:MAG: hypothetical protein LUG52_10430 [Clostridia bacterium]|nr:hypothetical protein [Clostridia bacterium]
MTGKLTELRNKYEGAIYVYLADAEICRRFLRDAEDEGYRFGSIKPTENHVSDIISLDCKKQLGYVGAIGHMAFQCGGGDNKANFHKVDYRDFLND